MERLFISNCALCTVCQTHFIAQKLYFARKYRYFENCKIAKTSWKIKNALYCKYYLEHELFQKRNAILESFLDAEVHLVY